MSRHQFVGELTGETSDWIEIDVKNRFAIGDQLELMTPQGNHSFVLEALQDRNGNAIEVAPGNGHSVRIPRPPLADLKYALLMRWLPA